MIGGTGPSAPCFARVDIPAGANVTASVPLVGCEVYNAGPQSFVHGAGGNIVELWNAAGGMEVAAYVDNIAYTTNGACPFGSGSDGAYFTNGPVAFPGVTVS